MWPELSMVPSLLTFPPEEIRKMMPEVIVKVSPEFTFKVPFSVQEFGAVQINPSASHELWSDIVPPTANASSENPINPKIKILTITGIIQMPLIPELVIMLWW